MSNDLLEQATQALRETSAEPQPRSGLTRARILESAEKRYVSRRAYGLRWVIALAAALAASTALARVAQHWPEIKRALSPNAERSAPHAKRSHQPQPASASKSRAAARQLPAAGSAAPVAPTQSIAQPLVANAAEAEPAAQLLVRPKPERRSPRVAAAPQVLTELPAPPVAALAPPEPAAESAELALFRRAQRLQLARDSSALAAWDDYLRVASQGVLVPEARYNRALCLVRAGRAPEARAALTPFARGQYGSYRRTEAQALLDALPTAPANTLD